MTGALCLQYPIPKMFDAARAAIAFLSSLPTASADTRRILTLTQALPGLVPMCATFPVLCDETTQLLLQLTPYADDHHLADAIRATFSHIAAVSAKL